VPPTHPQLAAQLAAQLLLLLWVNDTWTATKSLENSVSVHCGVSISGFDNEMWRG